MNSSIKNIIKSFLITVITVSTGFLITAISFNLFDSLSQNQMRLLFAIDVVLLLIIGATAYLLLESKKAKQKKKQEYTKRHNERTIYMQYEKVENMINECNFVA